MAENMIECGVDSLFGKQLFKNSNRYVTEHNSNSYDTLEEDKLDTASANDSEERYIGEYDSPYPNKLHDVNESSPLVSIEEQFFSKLSEKMQRADRANGQVQTL